MAIYGYGRVSTQMQADEGESLGVQERQVQGWCLMKGYDAPTMFIDAGVSASIPLCDRPQGKAMIAALVKGDTIVTSRLDRLFRSPLDALQTVDRMQKKGVEIVVIDGLGEITGNGMGRAFMIIAATFAEIEREAVRDRVRTVKKDQRDRGRFLGGKIPFGMMVVYGDIDADGRRSTDLVENAGEQEIIALMKALRRDGKTLRDIQSTVKQRYDRVIALATISKVSSMH